MPMSTKKVEVTSCTSTGFWYRNKIGQVFDVYAGEVHPFAYRVKQDRVIDVDTFRLIYKTDCKDI